MATGYDNRAGGRDTFAFTGPNPVQTRSAAQGTFRGAQVVGGEARSGVVTSEVHAAPIAGQLGAFFNDLMEPYVQRRQEEEFFKGLTEQMSRSAGDEIRVSDSPINRIFGPTAYEQGAVFYGAKRAVSDWQTSMVEDMDSLKKMPPAELAKTLAESMRNLRTGDPFTDQAVMSLVTEASAPLVSAVSKERYKWQQETASTQYADAADSAGSALQQLGASFAATSEPTDEQSAGWRTAVQSYLSGMQKPVGMDDETWKKSLMGAVRQAAQSGNGYAVTALKGAGLLNILTDEERTKLEESVDRLSRGAREQAALSLSDDLNKLNGRLEMNGVEGHAISSNEAMAEAQRINEQFKRMTGFDNDLFDYKDVVGFGKSVWSALRAQHDREESRRWQVEDMMTRRNWEVQDRNEEAAKTQAQVAAIYGTGNVSLGTTLGVGNDGNYQTLAQADYVKGDFSKMVAAHRTSGWVAKLVSDQMRANIGTYIGKEYSKDFEVGFQRFEALQKADPATASDYLGNLYDPLLNYQRMVRAGTNKTTAFATAFGNPAQYTASAIDDKDAVKAITSYVDDQSAATIWGTNVQLNPFSRTNLNTSGRLAMTNAMKRELAVRMKNGGADIDPNTLIKQIEAQMTRNGSWERYGQFGWSNPVGTSPLLKQMNMQQQEADVVVPQVLDKRLKAAGFSEGASGQDYLIRQIRGPNGGIVHVTAYHDDNPPVVLAIPVSEFVTAANEYRKGRVATPSKPAGSNYNDVNPYRRVPGESTLERTARINREVAAGASPKYRRN